MKRTVIALLLLMGGSATIYACAPVRTYSSDIVLLGYEPSNYELLNAALDSRVCIVGTLSVDVNAARFFLEPTEANGVINTAPSRIAIDYTADRRLVGRLRDGERHRICGDLRDATPWESCETNGCRWYELRHPYLG